MFEAGIAAGVALITGLATLTSRIHRRIDEVHSKLGAIDRRVDNSELHLARFYVPKVDFDKAFEKMEDHMVRIEGKLDQMMMNRRSSDGKD
jgi:hypothetical protein